MFDSPSKSNSERFLEAWHHAIAQKNLDLMTDWVTDDVVLYSPAIFKPKRGRVEVEPLLRDVLDALEGYRVTKTWMDGSELLLEFEANVDGKSLQGVDRITLNEEGKLTQLKVYIRPYNGLMTLMKAVVRRNIQRLSGPKRLFAKVMFAWKSRS